jgi:hypothetical protein
MRGESATDVIRSRSPHDVRRFDSQRVLTRTCETFHHQTRAALGHVRNDGGAAMDLRNDTEIDGECEMNRGAFFQTEIFSFDENTVRAQVACAAKFAWTSWNGNVDRSACPMAGMETSLHVQLPEVSVLLFKQVSRVDIVEALKRSVRTHYAAPLCSCEVESCGLMSRSKIRRHS